MKLEEKAKFLDMDSHIHKEHNENISVSNLTQYSLKLIMGNISFCPLKLLCFLQNSFSGLHRRMMNQSPLLTPNPTNYAQIVNCERCHLYAIVHFTSASKYQYIENRHDPWNIYFQMKS
jgi:hypothetical protein